MSGTPEQSRRTNRRPKSTTNALGEIGIALHLTLSQKYPRSLGLRSLTSFDPNSWCRRPPKIPYSSYGNVLSAPLSLFHKIEEFFQDLHDRVSRQADLLENAHLEDRFAKI